MYRGCFPTPAVREECANKEVQKKASNGCVPGYGRGPGRWHHVFGEKGIVRPVFYSPPCFKISWLHTRVVNSKIRCFESMDGPFIRTSEEISEPVK